jgi:Zn-dependent protease with chaperone function
MPLISDTIKKLISFKNLVNPDTYFPTLSNKEHKDLFGSKISFNQEETDLCHTIIKGLDVEIFEVKHKEVNAFTIPGVGSISELKTDPVKYNVEGLKYLSKTPLTFKIDPISKNIIFNNEDFKILIFVNSGLIRKLKDPKDRLSVYLHEIGHWVYVTDIIRAKSFILYLAICKIINAGTIGVGVISDNYLPALFNILVTKILTYLTSVKTIQSEYDADKFVKQCGYGINLANSLHIMVYNKKITNLNVADYYSKLDTILYKFLMCIIVMSHPNTRSRIAELIKEDIGLNHNNGNIVNILMHLLDMCRIIKTTVPTTGVFNLWR